METEMLALRVAPGRALAIALLIVIGATGCSGKSAPGSVPAASGPASSAPATAQPSASAAQDLVAGTSVRSALLKEFAAVKKLPVSDIAGSAPGSLDYGYVPSTQTYWAMASYEPAKAVPLAVTVSFQDGGETGLFKKVGSGPWQAILGSEPPYCGELRFFPRPVLSVWALPTAIPADGKC
jgi:hypothetical protein